jgi:hypothetical protein
VRVVSAAANLGANADQIVLYPNSAIRELGRVPPELAISALEQVLRSDSDPDNRALAMQMLQQMPSNDEVRPLRARLMQEFSEDGDARVAALARADLR